MLLMFKKPFHACVHACIGFWYVGSLGKKLTGSRIFWGKLMGYGIFRSDKTGYRLSKSLILQMELTETVFRPNIKGDLAYSATPPPFRYPSRAS